MSRAPYPDNLPKGLTVDLEGLAALLDQADGMEVEFEPTPQGRRLLESLGVKFVNDRKEKDA
jgi:hypothetical protein